MPQTLLPLVPDGATPINALVSLIREGVNWTYCLGICPIFSHAEDDRNSFRMFMAQLVCNGLCKQAEIVKALGVTAISVKRSVKQYREGGSQSFYQPRRGRGASVMTPEVIREAQALLNQGNSRRETAEHLAIKPDTLGKAIQQGKLSEPTRAPTAEEAIQQSPVAPVAATDKSERGQQDLAAADTLGMACTRLVDRVCAAVGLLPGGATASYEPCRDVTFGGVLCAVPALEQNGLYRHLGQCFPTLGGYYTTSQIFSLLGYMALCRIKTVEQLQFHPPGELGKLLGLDRIPEVRCLRNKLTLLSKEQAPEIWAAQLSQDWMQAEPDLAGALYVDGHVRLYHGQLTVKQLGQLNDDRVGRSLDRLFDATTPQLLMDIVRQMVREFDLKLDELHNDSTSISFFGQYEEAAQEDQRRGKPTAAVTYGHSKDHRPDLKQLLYILTVTDDGGVPVYFTTASGNVTDDTTHQETWELLTQLTGRKDFLYVADCKLATTKNLQYIVNRGGRFISLLPRTRQEDTVFRKRLAESPGKVAWQHLQDTLSEAGELLDRLKVCAESLETKEGYRLYWYHSSRKQARDAAARQRTIERTIKELNGLEDRLQSPRTRFRERAKVQEAVSDILRARHSGGWVQADIASVEEETYKQSTPGRPSKNTKYVREVRERFRLSIRIDQGQVAADQASDGVFPLITSEQDLSAADALAAYKRQPIIEKRFSQFKTDFAIAPVYLQEISRIHSLLCIYFLALCVQTLLERELRQAMAAAKEDSLPLYPEERACRAPTTRRVLDVFEAIQRHELQQDGEVVAVYITELRPLHRQLLKLLGVAIRSYGQ